ncbi:MAG: hypothetical protein R3C99_03735 [Pirellulaceae bacterium]|nr:hypothetical protein [Planctomycetales bacterium]MCA9164858.1 hypothetical protein [Planctomycetales bacterium]MCA9206839.1 hypothetical protein [Planctomycetales bacterium]MCA9223222.1 hypothetical protein [Planctomycetales bacterium]
MSTRWILAVVWLSLSITGCGIGPFSRPPGTAQQQRYSATLHDPYPDNDLGPEVVGGRPRDFQQPRAEAVRNTASPSSLFRLRGNSAPPSSPWVQGTWWAP